MSIDNKYNVRADFLPNWGRIYVDTSVLSWVIRKKRWSIEKNIAELKRLSNFNRKFKERGLVLTTPLILAEIGQNIEHYKNIKNKARKIKKSKYCKKYGIENAGGASSGCRLWLAKKGVKEYRKVHAFLEEGSRIYVRNNYAIPPSDVVSFVEQFEKLSGADKELVVGATLSGSNNGILTADALMMSAYYRSTDEFGLRGCFVCNGIESKVSFI